MATRDEILRRQHPNQASSSVLQLVLTGFREFLGDDKEYTAYRTYRGKVSQASPAQPIANIRPERQDVNTFFRAYRHVNPIVQS